MIKSILINVKNFLLADFEYYKIFSASTSQGNNAEFNYSDLSFVEIVDESLIKDSQFREIQNNFSSINNESRCYGVIKNSEVVACCYVWEGAFYKKIRGFLPLTQSEAELTFLVVSENLRGAGIAVKLIDYAKCREYQHGTKKIFARVWHSNLSSEKSFLKSGWIKEFSAVSFRIKWFGKRFTFRR